MAANIPVYSTVNATAELHCILLIKTLETWFSEIAVLVFWTPEKNTQTINIKIQQI
jgi:hypothetical protein